MSTDYQGQTTEQVIAACDQPYSSPYVSFCGEQQRRHFCLSTLYARASRMASIIPLDLLKEPHPESELLDTFAHTPEMMDVCPRIHQHLKLPSHHVIYWVSYWPQKTDWNWKLFVKCEEPPYPALGWDVSREEEGIWQCWRVITRHVCHGRRIEEEP